MSNYNNKGITFPYQEDQTGKFLRMNKSDKEEIKSQLSLLITTPRGQRLYKPDFGINLEQFLFQPMDDMTYNQVRDEITSVVIKYIPKIKIEKVELNTDPQNHFMGVRVLYTISDGVIKDKDEINIAF